MNLKLAHFVLGPIQTNAYVVVNEDTGTGFLVDPGEYREEVEDTIKELGIKELKYILLTHGHYDHILGVNGYLKNHPGAHVVISKWDEKYLTDGTFSLATKHGLQQDTIPSDIIIEDGSTLEFDDTQIQVVHTPGHTPGGVCFLLDDFMFSGDTLFKNSCGRTDFQESSTEAMLQSLDRLAAIDKNYYVLPGHGPFSTLDEERKNNPYMNR